MELLMSRMIGKLLGYPGLILLWPLIIGVVVLISIVLIGSWAIVFAPVAVIPVFLLVLWLPTFIVYNAAALVVYLIVRLGVWLLSIGWMGTQWIAGAIAVGLTVVAGYLLPNTWNSAAGLQLPIAQHRPPALAIPNGGTIAFIDQGHPETAYCDGLCLSLLIQERVKFVDVASTLREPRPLEALTGKRYSLTPQTRNCLKGMPDYTFKVDKDNRLGELIEPPVFPSEYNACLNNRDIVVKPEQQTTLVEWVGENESSRKPKAGFSGPVSVIRAVIPQGLTKPPIIREARYQSGYRYDTPLHLQPFDGWRFSPTIATTYFKEPGFLDANTPRFWSFLIGSEELGRKTALWLDGVVEQSDPN